MVIVIAQGGGGFIGAQGGFPTASGEAVEAGPVKTVLGAEEMFEAEPALDVGSARGSAGRGRFLWCRRSGIFRSDCRRL